MNTQPQLQPGWEQANDPISGRPYYANRSTGETSWEPPHFPPPPPPPLNHNMLMQQPSYHPSQHQQVINHAAVPQQLTSQSLPADYLSMQSSNFNNNTQQYHQPNHQHQPQVVVQHVPSVIQSLPPNDMHIATQQQQHIEESQSSVVVVVNDSNLKKSGLGPSTALTKGMLVSSIQAMINEEYAQKQINQQQHTSSSIPKLELEGLTAGVIADLCNASREFKSRNADGGDFAEESNVKQGDNEEEEVDQYYAPLQPFDLPICSIPPHIEQGRLDIRLHTLHTKLGKI